MTKVLLGEMNLEEVENYMKTSVPTVIVPIGTTEQHGAHLPYLTDTLIPTEVAQRVAKKINALVAPALPYGLSQGHIGFPGIIWLSGTTLIALLEELAINLSKSGFKKIIFINGHFCNDQPLFVALNDVTSNDQLPKTTKVYGLTYWNALSEENLNKYLSWDAGWHANIGETSAILAIDPNLVNMKNAVKEDPDINRDMFTMNLMATQAGGFGTFTKSGVWGDPRNSTKELGEKFLTQISNAIVTRLGDYEKYFKKFSKLK